MATSRLCVFLLQAEYEKKNASLKQRGSRGLIRAQFSPTQIGRLKQQPQVRQATERGANGVFGGTSFFSSPHLKLKVIEISKSYSVFPKKKRHIIACTAFFSFGFRDLNAMIPYWTVIPWKICVSQNSSSRSSAFVRRDGGVSLVKVWKKTYQRWALEL